MNHPDHCPCAERLNMTLLQVSELTKQRDRARGFADDYLADLTRMQRRAEAAEAQVSGIKAAIERKRDTAKSVLNNEAFGCAGSVMGILNDILGECFPDKPKEESPFPTASDLKVYRAVDKFMGACEAHRMTDCRHCVTEKRISETCDHDWMKIDPDSAHVIQRKCRKCGLLAV